jgi:hypothetical protein
MIPISVLAIEAVCFARARVGLVREPFDATSRTLDLGCYPLGQKSWHLPV